MPYPSTVLIDLLTSNPTTSGSAQGFMPSAVPVSGLVPGKIPFHQANRRQFTATSVHKAIQEEAKVFKPVDINFGFGDVAKWKTDPEYLNKFKDNFVYQRRDIIVAAAKAFDLPPELLAGVVRVEIGGKDPIKKVVYYMRTVTPFSSDRDRTSLGQQAMQIRRAAETLGYNPAALTSEERDEIIRTLEDPSQSIFITAKHLSDLRHLDFPGKPGNDLTMDDVKVIGARYNQGPDKPLADIKTDLSYGTAITSRWGQLKRLLISPPATLEYSPVENNIVKPVEDFATKTTQEIYRLYNVPFH